MTESKNETLVDMIKRDKNDILGMPLFGFLFKNPGFILSLRVVTAALFVYAIVYGFINTGQENIFTKGVFWVLFWPFFMVVTLGTFGRIFCGICPLCFSGRILTRSGLRLSLPKFLKTPYIGLFLLIVGWWAVFYMNETFFRTPLRTAVLFTVITLVAFTFFFLFKDMAFCKSICPVGTATRAFAKVSFTWLGAYQEGCKNCREFNCAKACSYGLKPYNFDRTGTMNDCTLCMDCASGCENISFKLKAPSHALFKKFKPSGAEVWAYLMIIAAISITMVFHHALGRSAIATDFPWAKTAALFNNFFAGSGISATGLFAFLYSVAAVLFFSLGGMFIASKILKAEFKQTLYTLGYAFAPIFIIGGLSHLWEMFFLDTYSSIGNAFIQGFGLPVGEISPLATRQSGWLRIFTLFNYAAAIWAFVIMFKRLKFLNSRRLTRLFAFPFSSALIIFFICLQIYVIYVFATYGAAARPGHHHGSAAGQRFQSVPVSKAVILQKGENKNFCNTCGMNLTGFFKTNHAILLKNGETLQYCSLHCLVDKFRKNQSEEGTFVTEKILVVDTKQLEFVEAKKAYYIVGSRNKGTMSKISKYAFGNKEDALAYAEEYGGELMDFDQAFATASNDFQ
jgi:nitrous oxide reductase accessory protein NosL